MTHDRKDGVRIVPLYEVDTLGAPFKVTIYHCAALRTDPVTGEETVNIPDLVGLINAVVRARVTDDRKLNGREIKFVRNALGLRAKQVAEFLDMSPEHFSRCEAGTKPMSAGSEKTFRMFAFLGTHLKEPSTILEQRNARILDSSTRESELTSKKVTKSVATFLEMFLSMKIQPVFPAEELHFEFSRRARELPANDDDDVFDDSEWIGDANKDAA